MKRISTLLSMLCLVMTASAQINETFDNYTDLSALSANCWNFSGVGLTTTSSFGSNSLYAKPSNGGTSTAQFSTPYINWTANSTLTFKVRIDNKLNNGSTRTIQARQLNAEGVYSSVLQTMSLDKNTSITTTYLFSITVASASIQKLVIDITAVSDANTSVLIDDITYASTFNYTGNYNCNAPVTAPTPLPVHLTSFTGNVESNKVQLTWTADDNETGNYFEIEKSSGDNKFKTIAIISNTKTVGTENYSYKDAADANQYSNYRLKIVNKDNTISYSKIIAFKAKSVEASGSLTLLQNPVTSNVAFNYTATASGVYTASLYNTSGVKILSKQVRFQKGMNATTLSLNNNTASGTYILEVAGNTERGTVKVSRQ